MNNEVIGSGDAAERHCHGNGKNKVSLWRELVSFRRLVSFKATSFLSENSTNVASHFYNIVGLSLKMFMSRILLPCQNLGAYITRNATQPPTVQSEMLCWL